jgi:hypothetical protein
MGRVHVMISCHMVAVVGMQLLPDPSGHHHMQCMADLHCRVCDHYVEHAFTSCSSSAKWGGILHAMLRCWSVLSLVESS